jgi:hypothetical protein
VPEPVAGTHRGPHRRRLLQLGPEAEERGRRIGVETQDLDNRIAVGENQHLLDVGQAAGIDRDRHVQRVLGDFGGFDPDPRIEHVRLSRQELALHVIPLGRAQRVDRFLGGGGR